MSYILLRSGHKFDPSTPEENTYLISDIAHALSKECRYAGHCNGAYSVAQHSVMVSNLVPKKYALIGLMHDATEAYIRDMPKPIKAFLGPAYNELEERVWKGIARTFDLPEEIPEAVHVADREAMGIEIQSGIAPVAYDPEWDKYRILADGTKVVDGVWTQQAAEHAFLYRFGQLVG